MLITTHRDLAFGSYMLYQVATGKYLDPSVKHEIALLTKGCEDPDRNMDFPHHRGKNLDIAINLLKARIFFLEKSDECFYYLGLALHYIQDKWTLRPKIAEAHTVWEEDIAKFGEKNKYAIEDEVFYNELISIPNTFANWYKLYNGIKVFNPVHFVTEKSKEDNKWRAQIIPSLSDKTIHWLLIERTEDNNSAINVYNDLSSCLTPLINQGKVHVVAPTEVQLISYANLGHPSKIYSTPGLDYKFAFEISRWTSIFVLSDYDIIRKFTPDIALKGMDRWFNIQTLQKSLGLLLDFQQRFKYSEIRNRYYPIIEEFLSYNAS
jgi:hypothetical protein